MKSKNVKKLLLVLGLCAATGITAGILLYYTKRQEAVSSAIFDINNERDSQFILQAFKDDWYWLVAEGSVFSPQSMIDTHMYYSYPLSIKVSYEDNEPTGFAAYYMQSLLTGSVLFLYVAPAFRSKGWGRKLLDYAVKDLAKRGAVKIELTTRTNNEASQRLYNRYGFHEIRRYGGFVEFSYLPKK